MTIIVASSRIYDGLDSDVKGKLVFNSGEISKSMERSRIEYANVCRLVYESHELLAGSESTFREWVEMVGIARSTAYDYIRVWKTFGKVKHIGNFEPAALLELSKTSTPEEARNEAIKEAKRCNIDGKRAKELIACPTVGHTKPQENKDVLENAEKFDASEVVAEEWEDVTGNEPEYVDANEQNEAVETTQQEPGVLKKPAKQETSIKEQAAKLRSSINQYNAYMMRAVGDLHTIVPNKAAYDYVLEVYRSLHTVIEAWK